MTTWFTSDQHFGHENIIGYCGRPFRDADEMNMEIVRRWNEVVARTDTVYVLGDYALGRIDRTLAITAVLMGRKILLAGNHDRCWTGHGGLRTKWIEQYLAAGFAEVLQGTIRLDVGGTPVQANHFPFVGDSHDGDRFESHRPVDDGGWLLHGHVHEKWQRRDRMINVGVDVWNFYPVAERELAGIIQVDARGKAEDLITSLSDVMDRTIRRL